MVANTTMETDKIKRFGARVRVSSVAKVSEIESVEKEKMKNKVEKILNHNINLFINRQLIYNYPEAIFTEAKVNTIEHADFEGIEQLALVLEAEIVSTFDNLEQVKYGTCEYVKEILVGEDRMIKFINDKKSSASTIILRGSSDHIIAEAERSIHDALCVLTQTITTKKIVLGGGASEMYMALKIDELARKTSGKQALAMESFSRALRQIPAILADNGGYDASELISKLRSLHEEGMNYMGLNMHQGKKGSGKGTKSSKEEEETE
jgi:T-complex protein 1 subunit beta